MAHHGDIAMRGVSRWGWLMAPLLLTLGACAEPTNHFHAEPSVSQLAQDRSSGDGRRLEVTHQFTLRVPNAETEGIQQKHIAECIKLGCAIVSTSIDRSNEGRVSAQATIRIKPESYDAFATLLAAPPVKVIVHSQSAEDLGLTIIDTEKRIETKTLFRDRLTAMLRDQSVKAAADLITIEKELAQAQGEIEAMTAQRDSLRTRTDTVRINISYTGAAVQFGGRPHADLSSRERDWPNHHQLALLDDLHPCRGRALAAHHCLGLVGGASHDQTSTGASV
jgi:hypothetical protein